MRRSQKLDLTSQKVLTALQEMGVTRAQVLEMQAHTAHAEGEQALEALKAACKKGFRAAARRLHPDQNEGASDQAEKTERFKYLRSVYERFSVIAFVARPAPFRRTAAHGPFPVYADVTRKGPNKNGDTFYYRTSNPTAHRGGATQDFVQMMREMQQRAYDAEVRRAQERARRASDFNDMKAREQQLREMQEALKELQRKERMDREGRARRRRREAKAREARKTEEAQSRKKGAQFRGGVDSSVKSAPGVLASDALFEESSHQTFDGISGWYSDYMDRSFEEMDAEIDIILRKMGIR